MAMDELTQPDLRKGFSLGPWTILPNQNRMESGSESVHLEPKVMEVLCVLARSQGEVVSRNGLLDEVWAGTYVTDEVVSRAISVLRSQLGDDRKNPEYILTIPKAGYRLIKPVVFPGPEPSTTEDSTPSVLNFPARRRWFYGLIAIALLLLLVILNPPRREQVPESPQDARSPTLFADMSDWFDLIILGDAAPDDIVEIAVLPFDDISEQAGSAFLSDGLTDELINSLAQLSGLKVVARSSSLNFRNRYEDVRYIGETLKVDVVVEGTVKRVGDRIRISAQMSSTEDGYLLWSQSFDRELHDLLTLQGEISSKIVAALREKLKIDGLQIPTQLAQADLDAYQLYLNGRFLWKLRGDTPLRKSIAMFEQALVLDPDFARARLALANALVLLPYYGNENEDESFERALNVLEGIKTSTSAEQGEVEAIHGFIAFRRWQWQRAEQQFHKALVLAPNNPNIYVWYSQFLSAVGRNVDALKAAEQARELDSVSPVVNHRLAIAYLWNNDNLRAAEQYALGAELGFANIRSPSYLIFQLRTGRYDEAGSIVEQIFRGSGSNPDWFIQNIVELSSGTVSKQLKQEAVQVEERGDIFARLQLGLWLYLGDSRRAYETVKELSDQKKYVDMELIFAAEGQRFRQSREFQMLADEIGLTEFWDSWRGPDDI